MKTIRYTPHALIQITDRKLDMLLVEQTIRVPQETVIDDDNLNRTIYHSLYTSTNGKLKLLRVVVEEGIARLLLLLCTLRPKLNDIGKVSRK